MREFILLASKARTTPDFDNLVKAGRMDLVCRFISNCLCYSNGIRKDTNVYVVLNGPKNPPRIIIFLGAKIERLEPDEFSLSERIKVLLRKGSMLKLNEESNVFPGISIMKKSFEKLVEEKSKKKQLIYLDKKGEDIRNFSFNEDVIFIIGDAIGLPLKTERLVERLGAKKIRLSNLELFASHCPVIINYELDNLS